VADRERRIKRIEDSLRIDHPSQKEAARRKRISRRQAFAACVAESRGLTDEVLKRCFPKLWRWISVRPENAGAIPEADLTQLESLPEVIPLHGTEIKEDTP
jgi:hypothetical protein